MRRNRGKVTRASECDLALYTRETPETHRSPACWHSEGTLCNALNVKVTPGFVSQGVSVRWPVPGSLSCIGLQRGKLLSALGIKVGMGAVSRDGSALWPVRGSVSCVGLWNNLVMALQDRHRINHRERKRDVNVTPVSVVLSWRKNNKRYVSAVL